MGVRNVPGFELEILFRFFSPYEIHAMTESEREKYGQKGGSNAGIF